MRAAAAGGDHLLEQADVAAAMFHVVDDEVEPAGIEHGAEAGSEELKDELAEKQLALLEPLANAGHCDSRACATAFRRASFSMNCGWSSTCGIDDVFGSFSAIDGQRAFAIDAAHVAKQLFGPGDGVRCEDDVVHGGQGRIGAERLALEHVKGSAGDLPAAEGRRSERPR